MPLLVPETKKRFPKPEPWRLAGREFDWGARTYVMGILNVTPDSFSDGGRLDPEAAIAHALRMIADGADLIDVGGESTRPGCEGVTAQVELERILPVVRALADKGIVLSVDTFKPEVADRALHAGAALINDISGLRDPEMLAVAKRHQAPVIAMHMQGTPQTMQRDPRYADVVSEVREALEAAARHARDMGVQVMVDPGIGFGKTQEHNLALLRHLNRLHVAGCPMLLGTSRKGFIGNLLGLPVNERVEGTMATVALAVSQGVDVVRVHDVKEASRTVRVADAIVRGKQ